MSNGSFLEIDFLHVKSSESGDAIPIRIHQDGVSTIHIVDGGFQDTGRHVIDHVRKYYDDPAYVDRVIVTHPDGDHAGGVRSVLEEFDVGELWMLRPWLYAEEILNRFARVTSTENLKKRLRDEYTNISALEDIANEKNIPIYEPYQGATIGPFTVMSPTRARYLDLIVQSDRTPEAKEEAVKGMPARLGEAMYKASAAFVSLVKSAWGKETFSQEETSAENEMSVVQYANIRGTRVLLTGDTGRSGLTEAADYADEIGVPLPGIDRFQVPHHGSRRNVDSEILDRWLGEILSESERPAQGQERFVAMISASADDEDHPRKAVVRACHHRGGKPISTKNGVDIRVGYNTPKREGWGPVDPLPYPDDQEE